MEDGLMISRERSRKTLDQTIKRALDGNGLSLDIM